MKTKIFFLIAFALFCLAQQTFTQNTDLSARVSPEALNRQAAVKTDSRNARFSGLSKFLSDSLQYPELARKNCIEGTVVVEAVIGADGSVSELCIAESLGFGCDEAVLTLMTKMPGWEPAVRNGVAVEQKILVPVRFKLQ